MAACNIRQRLSEMNPEAVKYFMEKLLSQIYQHFDEQCLVDVTFKLSNPTATITAHRLILSSASPYFRELFKSDKGLCPLIEFSEIDSETFENLITFCYTGETGINIDNVERMLKAALMLQLDVAVTNCVDFVLENITVYTLQRAYALEREIQCTILKQKIFEYETRNFMTLIQSVDFLNFEANKLQQLLECDNLNVPTEKDVFEAVKLWYEHDSTSRQQEIPNLVKCLRLTQFDANFLMTEIQTLPGCELIAFNAISWISCPSVRSKLSLKYTEQRGGLNVSGELFMALNIDDHSIYQYNKTEDIWHKWGDINIIEKGYRAVLMDENLVFIGGTRSVQRRSNCPTTSKVVTTIKDEATNNVKSWNFKTKTFKQLPSMNQARHSHCIVMLHETLYAIGGIAWNEEYLKSVEKLSGSTSWKSINSMIKPRSDFAVVSFNGKMYVMGGYSGSDLNSVECYDPTTDCWIRVADMHAKRRYPSSTVHNGQIFVIGGCYGGCYGSSCERYDPQRNEWTKISIPLYVKRPGCISIDGKLWTVGGSDDDRALVYDEENEKWVSRNRIGNAGSCYCFTVPKIIFQIEC